MMGSPDRTETPLESKLQKTEESRKQEASRDTDEAPVSSPQRKRCHIFLNNHDRFKLQPYFKKKKG